MYNGYKAEIFDRSVSAQIFSGRLAGKFALELATFGGTFTAIFVLSVLNLFSTFCEVFTSVCRKGCFTSTSAYPR
jgi:hypothetical protein